MKIELSNVDPGLPVAHGKLTVRDAEREASWVIPGRLARDDRILDIIVGELIQEFVWGSE